MIVRRLPPWARWLLAALESLIRMGLLLVRYICIGLATLVAILWIQRGTFEAAVLAAIVSLLASAALLSPSLWSRLVFEPLGWWRCAWVAGRISVRPWRTHTRAGALVAAGRAALRSRDHAGAIAYLQAALRRAARLDGPHLVAAAVLALVEGREQRARQLFRSLSQLDPRAVGSRAQALASEWLALDAAERGDWDEAREQSAPSPGRTHLTRLVHEVAALAITDREQGRPLRLWFAWLLAPGRRENRRIIGELEQSRGTAAGDASSSVAPPPPPPATPPQALGRLVNQLGDAEPGPERVAAVLAAATVVADDPELAERARVRARVLGVDGGGDDAVEEFRRELEADVSALVLSSGVTLDELRRAGPLGERIADRLRDRIMSEVEDVFEALERRIAEDRHLPPVDEMVELSRVVHAHREAVRRGGDEVRYLLWPLIHRVGCDYGVWLHDHPRHRVTGNAVFRFLLDEARAATDESAVELQQNNVAVGF